MKDSEVPPTVMPSCLISLIQSRLAPAAAASPRRRRFPALPRWPRRPGRPPSSRPGTDGRPRHRPACWTGSRRGWRPPPALGRGRCLSAKASTLCRTDMLCITLACAACPCVLCLCVTGGAASLRATSCTQGLPFQHLINSINAGFAALLSLRAIFVLCVFFMSLGVCVASNASRTRAQISVSSPDRVTTSMLAEIPFGKAGCSNSNCVFAGKRKSRSRGCLGEAQRLPPNMTVTPHNQDERLPTYAVSMLQHQKPYTYFIWPCALRGYQASERTYRCR